MGYMLALTPILGGISLMACGVTVFHDVVPFLIGFGFFVVGLASFDPEGSSGTMMR